VVKIVSHSVHFGFPFCQFCPKIFSLQAWLRREGNVARRTALPPCRKLTPSPQPKQPQKKRIPLSSSMIGRTIERCLPRLLKSSSFMEMWEEVEWLVLWHLAARGLDW
jgi:hypothetical protein